MRKSKTRLWEGHVRAVANAMVGPDGGCSLASALGAQATPATVPTLLRLSEDLSIHPQLSLPPEISPLDTGIVWRRAIALLIGSMRPFPLETVRAALNDLSASRGDVWILSIAVIHACEQEPALNELVVADIMPAGRKMELEDILDVLRFAGSHRSDKRLVEAVASGLKWHSRQLEVSTMSRIEVAAAMLAVARPLVANT